MADKLELRSDIQFKTRIIAARYNEQNRNWEIRMDDGTSVIAEYFITALGCLSASNITKLKGSDKCTTREDVRMKKWTLVASE